MNVKNTKTSNHYQISSSLQEIVSVLLNDSTLGQSIIWQTKEDSRVICDIASLDVEVNQKKITLTTVQPTYEIEPVRPVYIKLPFRQSVFKGRVLKIKGNKIELSLPHEIHWKELREKERLSFKLNEHFAFIKPYIPHADIHSLPSFRVSILDITTNGLGFYVSGENESIFAVNKFIDLVGIDEQSFEISHTAVVLWRQRIQTRAELAQGLVWRIGIRFLNALEQKSIDLIKS